MRDEVQLHSEAQAAATAAVWLADTERARILWANATLLRLLGIADLAALQDGPVPRALLAAARSTGDLVLQAGGRVLHGAIEAAPVVLADGRLGIRAVWLVVEPEVPNGGALLRAAAFEATPLPLAVIDAEGTVCAANAALLALGGPEGLDNGSLRLPLPGTGGCMLMVGGPARTAAKPGIAAEAMARIAHEFRSPLTAVLGFAEFLRAGLSEMPTEKAQGYLDDLATAAERMRLLADALVAIGDGRHGLHIAEVALDPLLAGVLRLIAPQAARRGVALAAPAATSLHILADGEALSRAVINLLDNAIRHAGGTVRLTVEDRGRETGACIVVADDGPGLDAAALEAALRPYGRPNTRTETRAGGLGLPIVQEIAEAHGGELAIDTAPGRGLTARLSLPPARVFRTPLQGR